MHPTTCKIAASVTDTWSEFDVDQAPEEVVAALVALPPDQVVDRLIDRLPVRMTERIGAAFGRRFRMIGWPGPISWQNIIELHPI